jgi:hypothetical protein
MRVNPCYTVLNDPTSTFNFQPNKLTITTSCSTYDCQYSLDGFSFALGACTTQTDSCPSPDSNPAETYI